MSYPEDLVRGRLAVVGFPEDRYVIHERLIDEVLKAADNLPKLVGFAYVEFDFYEAIRQTLEFLYELMPVGAVVVVDDYDFFSTGVKQAVDKFMAATPSAYDYVVPDTRYGHFAVL